MLLQWLVGIPTGNDARRLIGTKTRNSPYCIHMTDTHWSNSEKRIARCVYDAALEREPVRIGQGKRKEESTINNIAAPAIFYWTRRRFVLQTRPAPGALAGAEEAARTKAENYLASSALYLL